MIVLLSPGRVCRVCGKHKPLNGFPFQDRRKGTRRRLCKSCRSAYEKDYRERNAEKYLEHRANRKRDYAKENASRARKRGPVYMRWLGLRKTELRLTNGGCPCCSLKELQTLFEMADGRCAYCGRLFGEDWHVDHRTPLSRGGLSFMDNLAIVCRICNQRKHTKTEQEFLMWQSARFMAETGVPF